MADVFELFPFENTLVIADVSEKDLRLILENSVSKLPEESSAFLQTNGLEYTVDLSRKSQVLTEDGTKIIENGDRIRDIKINGNSIIDDKYYKIALNDYLFAGGDGYSEFKNAKNIKNTGVLIQNLIVEYIKKKSPLDLEVKDRINFINYNVK